MFFLKHIFPNFCVWISDVFLVVHLFCNNLLYINPNYIIFLCILNVWLFNLWSILGLRLLVPNINSVAVAVNHVRNLTECRVGLGNHVGLWTLKLRAVMKMWQWLLEDGCRLDPGLLRTKFRKQQNCPPVNMDHVLFPFLQSSYPVE